MSDIEQKIDMYMPPNKELTKEFYKFIELSATEANIMQLKHRTMQKRGDAKLGYYDQMPKTLYECFNNGYFSKYYSGDDNSVIEWIKSQKLECFFSWKISRENINPLIEGGEVHKAV